MRGNARASLRPQAEGRFCLRDQGALVFPGRLLLMERELSSKNTRREFWADSPLTRQALAADQGPLAAQLGGSRGAPIQRPQWALPGVSHVGGIVHGGPTAVPRHSPPVLGNKHVLCEK